MALEVIKTNFFNSIDECITESKRDIQHIYLIKDISQLDNQNYKYILEDIGKEFNPSMPNNVRKVIQLLNQLKKEYCIGIITNGTFNKRETVLKQIDEKSIDRQNKRIEMQMHIEDKLNSYKVYKDEKLKGLKKKILRRNRGF